MATSTRYSWINPLPSKHQINKIQINYLIPLSPDCINIMRPFHILIHHRKGSQEVEVEHQHRSWNQHLKLPTFPRCTWPHLVTLGPNQLNTRSVKIPWMPKRPHSRNLSAEFPWNETRCASQCEKQKMDLVEASWWNRLTMFGGHDTLLKTWGLRD